mmetsp:Transcript_27203/g.48518  ORF Transcript_27203/g.48518 Transcript_27203/m.48518 type:complete len:323 (-) Transcript_27203:90-1058(-)
MLPAGAGAPPASRGRLLAAGAGSGGGRWNRSLTFWAGSLSRCRARKRSIFPLSKASRCSPAREAVAGESCSVGAVPSPATAMTLASAFLSTARVGTEASPRSRLFCTSLSSSSPSTASWLQPIAVTIVIAASRISLSNGAGKRRQTPSTSTYGPTLRSCCNSTGEAATSYSRAAVLRPCALLWACPRALGASTSRTLLVSTFSGFTISCPLHWAKIVHLGAAVPAGAAPEEAASALDSSLSILPRRIVFEFSKNSTANVALFVHSAAKPAPPFAPLSSWKRKVWPASSCSSCSFGSSRRHHRVSFGAWRSLTSWSVPAKSGA